jgi:signal transduction histidine kinase
VQARVLDRLDGAQPNPPYFNPAARSPDGRVWFANGQVVQMVDPSRLRARALPAATHIDALVVDRREIAAKGDVQIPPRPRDLQIDYTSPTFTAAQQVRFRYRLDPLDSDWRDVGARRQAFYTDLSPGSYVFRVSAANGDGIWNEKPTALAFSVAPAWFETTWIRTLGVVGFAALLWGLYLLRVRQLRERFVLTLEARVAERTRIARDLHDTLLQSFHGLLLRFQTVFELMPNRPGEARAMLGNAIDQAATAISDGRDAVQALRTSVTESNNLAAAIRSLGDELRVQHGAEANVAMRVDVRGVTRPLHPIVRDETFRIAGEALRNALRHAGATQVEVEVTYDRQHLRVRVRDDGKGIDPQVLREQGRQGHFGLAGMRERAAVVGGRLTVWSALDSGTEIELTVPAANAYVAAARDTASSEAPHESTPAS